MPGCPGSLAICPYQEGGPPQAVEHRRSRGSRRHSQLWGMMNSEEPQTVGRVLPSQGIDDNTGMGPRDPKDLKASGSGIAADHPERSNMG